MFIRNTPVYLDDAKTITSSFLDPLISTCDSLEWSYLGKMRSAFPEINEIDLLLPRNEAVIEYLALRFGLDENNNLQTSGYIDGVLIIVFLASKEEWAGHLFYYSGEKRWQNKVLLAARKKGIILNQYGAWKNREKIPAQTEEDIFKLLDLEYIEPEERI